MVLEERANISLTLYRGINLYCDHGKKLLNSEDQTEAEIGARITQDFPRALFELGFFLGRTEWINTAQQIDATLSPVKDVELCLFDQLTTEGEATFSLTSYEKPALEVSWQQWRLESILKGAYKHDDFPGYLRSECRAATTSTAKIRTNLPFPKEDRGHYQFIRNGKRLALDFYTEEQTELPANSLFRYEQVILFERKIPEEIVQLLPRTS